MVLGRTTWVGAVCVWIMGSVWAADTGSRRGAEVGSFVTAGAAREGVVSGVAVMDRACEESSGYGPMRETD